MNPAPIPKMLKRNTGYFAVIPAFYDGAENSLYQNQKKITKIVQKETTLMTFGMCTLCGVHVPL